MFRFLNMITFDAPDIVKMRACYFVNRKQVWLVLDYFEKGSLETAIPFSHLNPISERAMAYVCLQVSDPPMGFVIDSNYNRS